MDKKGQAQKAKKSADRPQPSVTITIDIVLNHMDQPSPSLIDELFRAIGSIRMKPGAL